MIARIDLQGELVLLQRLLLASGLPQQVGIVQGYVYVLRGQRHCLLQVTFGGGIIAEAG